MTKVGIALEKNLSLCYTILGYFRNLKILSEA
jgi:hypothetical protein